MAITPIVNDSASVSAAISTLEQLDNFKKAGQTDWKSKIAKAYTDIVFDLKYRKSIDVSKVSDTFQSDFNKIHAEKTLSLIFEDQIDETDSPEKYERKAEKYNAEYEKSLDAVYFPYDENEDGEIDAAEEETTRSAGWEL